MTERTIFLAALDIADLAERRIYLERACGGDATLRRQVEALLAAHEREGEFLDVPAVEQLGAAPERTQPVVPNQESSGAELACLAPSQKPGSLGRLDHYEVEEVLGSGGMGVVFRALDGKLRRVVAIKVLAPHLAASGPARQRFIREAQAAAAIRDEHVVDIHAVEEAGPVPYLVMEYLDGITLDERIKQGGALEVKEILRIGLQAAKGLAAAHQQGLIHRDVKPANILLENSVQRVKLTDFGLARAVDDASLTQSGVVAGTPLYMSPEQARGEPVDYRSDLFSLGSVLYAMCTGRPPFRAESTMAVLKRVCEDMPRPIREVNPEVPGWLEAIVAKLHAKDPAQRFQSAAEVAELLGKHLAHLQQPALAPRPATVEVPARASRRRNLALAAAAAVLVALGALTTYLILRPDKPETFPNPGASKEVEQAKPFVPRRPLTADELAKLPSPLDRRKREDIPPGLLALGGGGDPAQAPTELVAMLGDARFRLPGEGLTSWMAQSLDGNLLAVPRGKTVVLFDAQTGHWLRTLTGHADRVYNVAISRGGNRLASTGHDQTVRVWDVPSGRELCCIREHGQRGIWAIAFSPDGKRVASVSQDRTVKVWDAETGQVTLTLDGPIEHFVASVEWSPDNRWLASAGGKEGKVVVWDVASGKAAHILTGVGSTNNISVAFSADGKLLAAGSDSGVLKIWDTDKFNEVRTLHTPASWLAFVPDGKSVLAGRHEVGDGSGMHTVTRWDVATGKELARLPLKSQGGYAVYHLSPDGKTLFGMRCDPVEPFLHAYDAATGKELFPRQGHVGPVVAVAVSPDGKTLASGGDDHAVRLWDLGTGKVLHTLTGHTERIWSLVFSPDGQLLASGSLDTTITLWDPATGKEVHTLSGHSKSRSLIRFSADGRTLAAGGDEGAVHLWDVATGKRLEPLRWHAGQVRAVAFSPDGRLLASGGEDNTIQLCEVASGRRLHTFRSPTPVIALEFTPDGRTLASESCNEHVVRLWDIDNKKELASSAHPAHLDGLAMHPGGNMLAAGLMDGTVHFWDLASGLARERVLHVGPPGKPIHRVAFTPESRYLATANDNGTISILRVLAPPGAYTPGLPKKLPDPAELAKRPSPADALKREDIPEELLKKAGGGDVAKAPPELVAILGDSRLRHAGEVVAVRFIDGDRRLISVGRDKTVRFWDVATGQPRGVVPIDTPDFNGWALSPDGKTLALGYDRSGTAKLWDTTTGKELHTLEEAAERGVLPPGLAFSPDGKRLASGGRYSCNLWDVTTGKHLHKLDGDGDNTFCLTFTPDGTRIASGNEGRRIVLWDVDNGKRLMAWEAIKRVKDGPARVSAVAFSPDGKTLAAGASHENANPEVKTWDAATGEARAEFRGHAKTILSLAYSADGKTIASGSQDTTAKLWDAATGKERLTLQGHGGAVYTVAFAADGKTLATASADGSIKRWDVATGEERFPRQGHTARLFTVAVSPDGKTLASAGEDRTIKLWDLATAKLLHTLTGHPADIRCVTFSPDGKTLASCAIDHTARLWDLAADPPREKAVLRGHADIVGSVAFSPDGKWLASASGDGTIKLWDPATGKSLRTFRGHVQGPVAHVTGRLSNVFDVAFSPDGRALASVGQDGTARLWDVAAGWGLATLGAPESLLFSVAFHPNGRTLASGGCDGAVYVWDLAAQRLQHTLPNPGGGAWTVAWNADGRLLASYAQQKGIVRVWDMTGTSPRVTALQLSPNLQGIAFTPEGRHLVVGNPDGTVYVLRLAKQGEVFRVPAEPGK